VRSRRQRRNCYVAGRRVECGPVASRPPTRPRLAWLRGALVGRSGASEVARVVGRWTLDVLSPAAPFPDRTGGMLLASVRSSYTGSPVSFTTPFSSGTPKAARRMSRTEIMSEENSSCSEISSRASCRQQIATQVGSRRSRHR
jgi:hypothetical protein